MVFITHGRNVRVSLTLTFNRSGLYAGCYTMRCDCFWNINYHTQHIADWDSILWFIWNTWTYSFWIAMSSMPSLCHNLSIPLSLALSFSFSPFFCRLLFAIALLWILNHPNCKHRIEFNTDSKNVQRWFNQLVNQSISDEAANKLENCTISWKFHEKTLFNWDIFFFFLYVYLHSTCLGITNG